MSLSVKTINGVIHVSGLERSLSPVQIVQKSTSATSLGARDDEAEVGLGRLLVPEFASAPPAIVDFVDTAVDADEEEYGEAIDRSEVANNIRLMELRTEGHPRGPLTASPFSLLSPPSFPDPAIARVAAKNPLQHRQTSTHRRPSMSLASSRWGLCPQITT